MQQRTYSSFTRTGCLKYSPWIVQMDLLFLSVGPANSIQTLLFMQTILYQNAKFIQISYIVHLNFSDSFNQIGSHSHFGKMLSPFLVPDAISSYCVPHRYTFMLICLTPGVMIFRRVGKWMECDKRFTSPISIVWKRAITGLRWSILWLVLLDSQVQQCALGLWMEHKE